MKVKFFVNKVCKSQGGITLPERHSFTQSNHTPFLLFQSEIVELQHEDKKIESKVGILC